MRKKPGRGRWDRCYFDAPIEWKEGARGDTGGMRSMRMVSRRDSVASTTCMTMSWRKQVETHTGQMMLNRMSSTASIRCAARVVTSLANKERSFTRVSPVQRCSCSIYDPGYMQRIY